MAITIFDSKKLIGVYTAVTTGLAPADSTTYYLGLQSALAATTTDTFRKFLFTKIGTIDNVGFHLFQTGVNGSNETVTLFLRNITTATNYTIGTFTADFGAGTIKDFNYTSLGISIPNTTDYYTFGITCPLWATNPTNWIINTYINQIA